MRKTLKDDGDLYSFLWDKAELLRSHMQSTEYKNYIFPLVFYKYICDTYDEEYEEEMRNSGSELLASAPANHRFVVPPENHWRTLRNLSQNLGKAISDNLLQIEKANADVTPIGDVDGILDGIFGDANWGDKVLLPDRLLKSLIEEFSTVNMSLKSIGEDALGNAYEYLLGQFADDSGQNAQEFFTNRTLVRVMVKILDLKEGDSVYDPTCGTAGMLIMSKRYAEENDLDYRTMSFYGQELYRLSACISRMNMLVHGIEDFHIRWGDTLMEPAFTIDDDHLRTFDVVLANPPYSLEVTDRERKMFDNDVYGRNMLGTPPSIQDFMFIQHILRSMDPETGRAAILLPHGLLSRLSEASIRENLVRSDLLECIIGVSKGLFFNSPMEACIFICRSKKSPEMKGKIKFIEASKMFVKNGNHNDLSPEHIRTISDLYFNPEDVEGLSKTVDVDEILADENRSLTVDRRISRLMYPEILDPNEIEEDLGTIRKDYHESLQGIFRMVE